MLLSDQSENCCDIGTGRAATICNTGPDCWLLVTTIVVPGRTSVLQQECDCGIFADPHIWTIFLQHSRSGAVMALSGIVQASSGPAVQQITRRAVAMAPERRMVMSLASPSFGRK